MAKVMIEATTRLKYTKQGRPFVGLLINGKWFNCEYPANMGLPENPFHFKSKLLDIEGTKSPDWVKIAGIAENQFAAQPPAGFADLGQAGAKSAPLPSPAPQNAPNKPLDAPKAPYSAPPAWAWDDMANFLRVAHALALELEAEPTQGQARSAIINTLVIALVQGKIALPTVRQELGTGDPFEWVEVAPPDQIPDFPCPESKK